MYQNQVALVRQRDVGIRWYMFTWLKPNIT